MAFLMPTIWLWQAAVIRLVCTVMVETTTEDPSGQLTLVASALLSVYEALQWCVTLKKEMDSAHSQPSDSAAETLVTLPLKHL